MNTRFQSFLFFKFSLYRYALAQRAVAEEAEKRAARAADQFRPTVRRSANTSNMTMTHVDEPAGPRWGGVQLLIPVAP